jgi:uncharacterized protein (TIGR03067 family)
MRAALLIAAFAVAVPDRPDPTPKYAAPSSNEITGDWAYRGNGKEFNPDHKGPNYVFRLTATESMWTENGQDQPGNGLSAKIVLDFTKNPMPIDFQPKRGGTPIVGIIRVENDRMVLAWSNDQTRPIDFSNAHNIHHFQRVIK